MLKFRETLWFKKGELDAEVALRAADGDDDLAAGAVDLLPTADRYCDDGSLSRTDSVTYGVHTGKTSWLRKTEGGSIGAAVTAYAEADVVSEMKRGRAAPYMVLIGAGLLALAAIIATFA